MGMGDKMRTATAQQTRNIPATPILNTSARTKRNMRNSVAKESVAKLRYPSRAVPHSAPAARASASLRLPAALAGRLPLSIVTFRDRTRQICRQNPTPRDASQNGRITRQLNPESKRKPKSKCAAEGYLSIDRYAPQSLENQK